MASRNDERADPTPPWVDEGARRLLMGVTGVLALSACGPSTRPNRTPEARAGSMQIAKVGVPVTLDGTGSSDPDGDELSFLWTLVSAPNGSAAALENPTMVHPSLRPDVEGRYVVRLVVSDGQATSAPAIVSVSAEVGNLAPTANAGTPQQVKVGAVVTLDGSASSDPERAQLTYSWSFTTRPAGSAAKLSVTDAAKPTFTADMAGTYVVWLVVFDGRVPSEAVPVTITAVEGNSAPVANAGPAQNVGVGSMATLDGSGSADADGDALTYTWSFTSRPQGSAAVLSSATAVRPSFTADLAGDYVVQLVVSDGKALSQAATVTVTAGATTTWVPTYQAFAAYLEKQDSEVLEGENNSFKAQGSGVVVSVPPIRFYNPVLGALRLFTVRTTPTREYAVNLNGDSVTAPAPFVEGQTIPLAVLTRSFSMTYAATSGPVTFSVTYTYANYPACSAAQLLFLKANGTIVKVASPCVEGAPPVTFSVSDPSNTELIIAFSRVTDAEGGPRIAQVSLSR